MDYAPLGRTGVFISRIGLGTMTFGGAGTGLGDMLGGLDAAAADRIVSRALDAGVNFVDTADVYGEGSTETVLGRVLGARRDDVVLATKFSGRTGAGPNHAGASRLHVLRALEASLRRLRTDHVDLYQLHSLDPYTPLEETLAALDDAVRQGKVRYVGASNLAGWQLMQAPQLVSTQSYYSLVGRDIERDLVPVLAERDLSLLVWSPLAGGLLSGKYRRDRAGDGRRAQRGFPEFPPVDRETAWTAIDVAHGRRPPRRERRPGRPGLAAAPPGGDERDRRRPHRRAARRQPGRARADADRRGPRRARRGRAAAGRLPAVGLGLRGGPPRVDGGACASIPRRPPA